MAILNDCAPQDALVYNHQQAINEVVARLNEEIAALQTQATTVDGQITNLQDTLDSLLAASGNPNDLRAGCNLPKNPTDEDIEDSIQGLTVVQGQVILPGDLNIVAIKRLYSIFKDINKVYSLVPELFQTPRDTVYGGYDGVSRLLTVVIERVSTEVPSDNPCLSDDVTIVEVENLVGVNVKLPEEDNDPNTTRVVVAVWIGPVIMSDTLRQSMVQLGYTDEEITNLILTRTQENFEVYSIKDPFRLGQYLIGVAASEGPIGTQSFLKALLTRGPDSINDSPTLDQYMSAFRNSITVPSTQGCGVHPSLGLLATINTDKLFPSANVADDCSPSQNIFAGVNAIFGGMGVIQQGIKKVMVAFQKVAGKLIMKVADLASFAEKNLLGVGPQALNATSEYGLSVQGPSVPVPGVPAIPTQPNVSLAQVDQFVNQLDSYMDTIEGFMNQSGKVVLGMSLLACASSQFGKITDGINLPVPGNPRIPFDMECAQSKLDAELDLSGLTFDWLNQGIQQLQDVIHRLRALAEELRQTQEGPEELFKLKCSITETVQLATDIARKVAAGNFGRF